VAARGDYLRNRRAWEVPRCLPLSGHRKRAGQISRLSMAHGVRAGAVPRIGAFATKAHHHLDKELAAQAELAYRRLVQDWQPAISKGAGAAPGRASRRPSSGQAARQETAPPPAL